MLASLATDEHTEVCTSLTLQDETNLSGKFYCLLLLLLSNQSNLLLLKQSNNRDLFVFIYLLPSIYPPNTIIRIFIFQHRPPTILLDATWSICVSPIICVDSISDFQDSARRHHAWSDNDLFLQKWTNKDLSENLFELELSSSCRKLSENMNKITFKGTLLIEL